MSIHNCFLILKTSYKIYTKNKERSRDIQNTIYLPYLNYTLQKYFPFQFTQHPYTNISRLYLSIECNFPPCVSVYTRTCPSYQDYKYQARIGN